MSWQTSLTQRSSAKTLAAAFFLAQSRSSRNDMLLCENAFGPGVSVPLQLIAHTLWDAVLDQRCPTDARYIHRFLAQTPRVRAIFGAAVIDQSFVAVEQQEMLDRAVFLFHVDDDTSGGVALKNPREQLCQADVLVKKGVPVVWVEQLHTAATALQCSAQALKSAPAGDMRHDSSALLLGK